MTDESFRDRLRRLRREEPACAEPTPIDVEVRGTSEASIQQSSGSEESERSPPVPDHAAVERRAVFARMARRDARVPEVVAAAVAAGSTRELSIGMPRDLVRTSSGSLARTDLLSLDHLHGRHALRELFALDRERMAEIAHDERLRDVDLSRAVFLDTETTGLSGGSGTYVFLVGLGRFVFSGNEAHFELWQGFMPHPAEERVLLLETAARIADASAIVSFFGKSFDRHRLEDKMRLHGVTPPFESCIHLDLYYPLRRLHRGKFENCRLKTLERELCGVAREDDLPGSFAPSAWFDFLANRAHRLEGVLQHNRDDVLSLVTLAAHAAAPH